MKNSPSRSQLQQLLHPHIIEALDGLPLDDAHGACRVARALVGEALLVLACAGGDRDLAVAQLKRALLTFYSTRVISPFGTATPGAKA